MADLQLSGDISQGGFKLKVYNLELIKTRLWSFRRAKNARRRVRVKVRAGQGISVEDIEDQLIFKEADDNTKYSLYNRPNRVNRERKTSNEYRARKKNISVFGRT